METERKRKFWTRTVTTIIMTAITVPAYFLGDGMILKVILSFAGLIAIAEYSSFALHAHLKDLEKEEEIRKNRSTPSILRATREGMERSYEFKKGVVTIASEFFMIFLFIGVIMPILLWNYSKEWLGLAIFTAVLTDIGAYLVGITIGGKLIRTRPFPKFSPNKTYEGLFGGYLFGFIACLLWKNYILCLPEYAWIIWVFPLLAILGDLFESGMKRFYEVKDANDHVPAAFAPFEALLGGRNGHGGYLDRLDSLTFILFVVAFIVRQTSY